MLIAYILIGMYYIVYISSLHTHKGIIAVNVKTQYSILVRQDVLIFSFSLIL